MLGTAGVKHCYLDLECRQWYIYHLYEYSCDIVILYSLWRKLPVSVWCTVFHIHLYSCAIDGSVYASFDKSNSSPETLACFLIAVFRGDYIDVKGLETADNLAEWNRCFMLIC